MSEKSDIKFIKAWILRWQNRWKFLVSSVKGAFFMLIVFSWIFAPIFLWTFDYGSQMMVVAWMIGCIAYVIGGMVTVYYGWKYLIDPVGKVKK